MLPGVDRILELTTTDSDFTDFPKTVVLKCARRAIDDLRDRILNGDGGLPDETFPSKTKILETIRKDAQKTIALNLVRTINATGVVVHTNLGRSLLSTDITENLLTISTRYSNLEFDLSQGKRGSRYSAVEGILCELTGAEAAMVVNNNAAAVLLCLDELSRGRQVILSRGELVEIGGSFRIPDVMKKSGSTLVEVGTTNRTHPKDYVNAITKETALLLKVHTSNYSVVGFTAAVELAELVSLGKKHNLCVMEDLGSGTLVDFSRYGLAKEPTVLESIATGADIVTFSGDKLLGGPQAGIIAGKKKIIERIRENPMTRALRIDKMTLAALEGTLSLYRDEKKAVTSIPTLKMLTMPVGVIEKRAMTLKRRIKDAGGERVLVEIIDLDSKAGGGSLPLLRLPSRCVTIAVKGQSANSLELKMRTASPPVIGRIENDLFILDPRTIQDEEVDMIVHAFKQIMIR